jgi:hypothetical protein
MNHSAITLRTIFHTTAKDTRHADNHFIARLNQVTDTSFHASAARARYRKRHIIVGLKYFTQQVSGLIHDTQITGI